jgi:hypothetical protein
METSMAETLPNFYPVALFVLIAILTVFAMKYAAAAYRSRLETKRQIASDETLAALQQEVNALTTRMNAVEKLLREVE